MQVINNNKKMEKRYDRDKKIHKRNENDQYVNISSTSLAVEELQIE